ncbi:Peptide chain release factor 1 [Planctomycetes bacterium Pan216]|uniref:Peptide chain release factor 1 n=1 Tax=Kolteria novifilia TaxID=2527975 RepID=A0A518AXL7_9BACT|nr:Peptide chain release factor 1 [Planctomycetes bacterium Pan216]
MARVDWWSLTNEELALQCDEDRYRASGPGGQKRNKTESAIRLRHRPTSLIVTAVESRSQHENRARALRRLREALAFSLRQPIDTENIPSLLLDAAHHRTLHIGRKDPSFLPVAASLLDLLAEKGGRLSTVGDCLETSTGSLVRFLRSEGDMWKEVQRIRRENDLPLLR